MAGPKKKLGSRRLGPGERQCVTVTVEGWGAPATSVLGWTYWVPGYVGELQHGDYVIVEAPRDERGRFVEHSGVAMLGKVSDAKPPKTIRDKASKWIVCAVDWAPYLALSALAPKIEES